MWPALITTLPARLSVARFPSRVMSMHLLPNRRSNKISAVFRGSTCNRTEIYGFAEHVMLLVNLLTKVTRGTRDEFLQFAYLKSGMDALNHLYNVTAGLDSQILGDYEILGQIKQSVDMATSFNMIGPIMNRTVNYAFQASKK